MRLPLKTRKALDDIRRTSCVNDKLLDDLIAENRTSPIYTHHIDYINSSFYRREVPYGTDEPNQIVVDYIASMTDDYFVDLYTHLFPESKRKIEYKGYFC